MTNGSEEYVCQMFEKINVAAARVLEGKDGGELVKDALEMYLSKGPFKDERTDNVHVRLWNFGELLWSALRRYMKNMDFLDDLDEPGGGYIASYARKGNRVLGWIYAECEPDWSVMVARWDEDDILNAEAYAQADEEWRRKALEIRMEKEVQWRLAAMGIEAR